MLTTELTISSLRPTAIDLLAARSANTFMGCYIGLIKIINITLLKINIVRWKFIYMFYKCYMLTYYM